MSYTIIQADCIQFLDSRPADSIDLCFFSPPYEQARLYLEGDQDMKIARDTEQWVAWIVQVFKAALRATKGLVACVCEGQTRDYRYSCGPALLMADLHRSGIHLRKPPIYRRVGIPGSGGPDWLRNDWEWIVCAANGGKLPWSDNTALGHPPKWAPGGEMSHRLSDGARVNQWGHSLDSGATVVDKGGVVRSKGRRPSHKIAHTKRRPDGSMESQGYAPPVLANPGNVIDMNVGGGHMGSALAHENEAPFPEKLAEFFVLSFCPPGGLVCDPFSGSGTTAAVSVRHGRNFVGCDCRQSQVDLGLRRVSEVTPLALFAE